jgi:hypothetical protein
MREAMDLISLIGMAQSIQHCGHMRSECKLGFEKVRMLGDEPGSQSWGACMKRYTKCAWPGFSGSLHIDTQLSK